MLKPIDYILLLPLIYGAWEGYKKGFLLTFIGSISLILGIIGGFRLMSAGIEFLKQYFPHMPTLLPFVSFVSIFLIIVISVYLLGVAIKKVMDFTFFAGIIDNLAGMLVGVFHWAFTLSILLWFIKQSGFIIPDVYTKEAPVFSYLAELSPKVVKWFSFLIPYANGLFRSVKEFL